MIRRLADLAVPEQLAAKDELDEVGRQCVITFLFLDHPGLADKILDRVPVEHGGRWTGLAAFQEAEAAAAAAEQPA